MASNGEGASFHRPPIFNGEEYSYWKTRMIIFIQSIDLDLWDTIEKGPVVLQHQVGEEIQLKPRSLWTDAEKKQVQLDFKARNIIISALGKDEYYRVSQCKSGKEMWETLQVTHEGTTEVKRARLNTLLREYELFSMRPNESIDEVQKRFSHIVSHLGGLGKNLTNDEITNKILRCLDRSWQPKVTAISEARDLSEMTMSTLFGKLKEHEMELQRLKQTEEADNKRKSLALKATSSSKAKQEDSSDDEGSSSESDDDEHINLLARKFGKFMKKHTYKNFRGKPKFRRSNDSEPPNNKVTCFGCGKPGHYKGECPEIKEKEYKPNKSRNKKAYVAWGNSSESSSDSESDVHAKLCLIATHHSDDEVSNFSETENDENMSYTELHDTCLELFNELQKVTKQLSDKKKDIKLKEKLLNDVRNVLESTNHENEKLKKENFALKVELDYSTKKVEKLNADCNKLKSTFSKFDTSSKNLNKLLGSQIPTNVKFGIGFHSENDYFKNSFIKDKNKFELKRKNTHACYYCNMTNHKMRDCFIKSKGMPRGTYVWVEKGKIPRTNPPGPNINWVPKSLH
jgi:hypothetical protein